MVSIADGARRPAALVLVLLLSLIPLVASSCGTRQMSPTLEKKLNDMVSKQMAEMNIPGLVVGVWVPDKGDFVVARGKADIKTGEPVGTRDKFRIGSITKSFTAETVLLLVDEGRIKLDDPVDKFVEGIPGGDKITVRQLLNHTSGLFEYMSSKGFSDAEAKAPNGTYAPRELVDFAIKEQPYFAPGGGLYYSNTNYILLGMIIEKVTGKKAGGVIEEKVAEPLGMKNTYLPTGRSLTGQYAHGYYNASAKSDDLPDVTKVLSPSLFWTSGGMVSDLFDLKIWAKALAEGTLLKPETYKEQTKMVDIPGEQGISKYGLGVLAMGPLVGHNGTLLGYTTTMMYYPEEKATLIALANRDSVPIGMETLRLVGHMAKEIWPGQMPW